MTNAPFVSKLPVNWATDPETIAYLKELRLRYPPPDKDKRAFRAEMAKGTMFIDGLWTVVYGPFMRPMRHRGKELLLFPQEVSRIYVRNFSRDVENECWVANGPKYWKGHTKQGNKSPKGFQWAWEGEFKFEVNNRNGGNKGGGKSGGRKSLFPGSKRISVCVNGVRFSVWLSLIDGSDW